MIPERFVIRAELVIYTLHVCKRNNSIIAKAYVHLNHSFEKIKHRSFYLLITPLALSAFTHLWNPIGFPDLFFDEGVYMRRTMNVLNGDGPQERFFHDHPFLGQLFLAGTLGMTGYPESLGVSADASSIEKLYLAPRILMGLIAVVDTFLIYKIGQKRYDRRVAVIASMLFAVMPITWLLRRILLDSILLPFLLSSILLAIYTKDSGNKKLLVLSSGVLLGLAIFTKIPALTMLPLIGYLVYSCSGRNLKWLGIWFIPVILIPLLWPLQTISVGQFDLWLRDVVWQTQRASDGGFANIVEFFLTFDPVLFTLGIAGFVYAFIRRDFFILLFAMPFILFLSLIGFTQYFHWIPVLPVFCISAAVLITDLATRIRNKKVESILPFAVVAAIVAFGLTTTAMLITADLTSAQFEAAAFVVQYTRDENDVTILASPVYTWIFRDAFHMNHVYFDYADVLFYKIETRKILLMVDTHFMVDIGRGKQLEDVYNATKPVARFEGNVINYDTSKYPYNNMVVNYEGSMIEVRIKE